MPMTPSVRNHLFAVIAFTLIALALVRGALVVGHAPALGYADPVDQHNVAGCLGLSAASVPASAYGLPRPPTAYHGGGESLCYASSAMLLDAPAALARALGGADAAMPLQVFGLVNLAFFAALAAAVAIALRGLPGRGRRARPARLAPHRGSRGDALVQHPQHGARGTAGRLRHGRGGGDHPAAR